MSLKVLKHTRVQPKCLLLRFCATKLVLQGHLQHGEAVEHAVDRLGKGSLHRVHVARTPYSAYSAYSKAIVACTYEAQKYSLSRRWGLLLQYLVHTPGLHLAYTLSISGSPRLVQRALVSSHLLSSIDYRSAKQSLDKLDHRAEK